MLALGGCAGSSTTEELRNLASASTLPATQPATTAPVAEIELPTVAGPEDYVRLALERNPRLVAAANDVVRQRAMANQAGSLPDPMLTVMPIGDMAETAAGPVETMLSLGQTLLLPQKLSARTNAASREADATAAESESLRQTVAAEARQAYWDYWLSVRRLEVTRQSRDLLQDVLRSAEAQLAAGSAMQADVLRATTALATLENDLLDIERDQRVAAARLNRLIDRETQAPLPGLPEEASLESRSAGDDVEAVNPRLIAAGQQVAAAQAQLRSARLEYWPDLTVMANYNFVGEDGLAMMANGEDQWSLGFQVNIPLWIERRRAGVRAAAAAVAQRAAMLDETRNEVEFDVQQARADVEAARRMVALLQETVLPQAQQTLESTAAAYRAGNTDFLDYIDAWRQLLEFELAERRATAELGQRLAELDLALGRNPMEVAK